MNTRQQKKNRLIVLIEEAICGVQQEISKARQGLEALDSLQHLEYIALKLDELRSVLSRPDWETLPRPKPGIARLVVDTWPLHEALGDKIAQIEYDYQRLG